MAIINDGDSYLYPIHSAISLICLTLTTRMYLKSELNKIRWAFLQPVLKEAKISLISTN